MKTVAWTERYHKGFDVLVQGKVARDGAIAARFLSSKGVKGTFRLQLRTPFAAKVVPYSTGKRRQKRVAPTKEVINSWAQELGKQLGLEGKLDEIEQQSETAARNRWDKNRARIYWNPREHQYEPRWKQTIRTAQARRRLEKAWQRTEGESDDTEVP